MSIKNACKETYYGVKGDLLQCQKRPTTVSRSSINNKCMNGRVHAFVDRSNTKENRILRSNRIQKNDIDRSYTIQKCLHEW